MSITNATRLSDFAAGIGTEGAILKIDNANQRIGIGTQLPNQMLTVAGIVSATQYIGDGSQLEGITSAGLGTAIDETEGSAGAVVYYTDDLLTVAETTTINPPASASAAYTQYRDVKLNDSVDLIIETGDDFIPDILGIGTAINDVDAAGNGVFDEVYAGVIKNKNGLGAPAFANGLTSVGVITATGGFTGNVTGDVTGNVTGDVTGNVNNSSNLLLKVDGGEKVRVTSAGKVGINSISPGEHLDVVGNVDIKGGFNQLRITTGSPAVKFTDSDAPTGFGMVGVNNTSGSLVLRSDDGNALSSSYMGFEVDGAEKLRITATGGLHLTNGELLERFASYTSSANFNGGNVDLDDGMVHYCNQNLSGANTVNLTSSVGINTQMANGDMISLTLITAVNASSAYINHITVDHSTTPTEMWVGGSAPGSGDGGTSNVDIYTFNLLKNGSNSYITIGNHIKTS